jgi:hypothetical protein
MQRGCGCCGGMSKTPKPEPVTLLTDRDGRRLDIVPDKKGYTFRVSVPGDGDDTPVLPVAQWCRGAIELLVKCPDARDKFGLVTATATDLSVTGRTLGSRRKWAAALTNVGSDYNGNIMLEWSSSKPLALYEIGAAFKAMIQRMSEMKAEGEY